MIKRVFDDNDRAMYYCTLCNRPRPFKALQEANEHGRFCGQTVPTQPVFRSYTTAATFEEDDDTQVYMNERKTWQGLTEKEAFVCKRRDYFETYKAIEAKLKEKNT